MRIISFCADGVVQAADNGFYDWAFSQDADIICIQDLREQEYNLQADRYHPEGYYGYFLDCPNGNINGVAIYVRDIPKAIMTGLGFGELDIEARYIQADFENLSIGCLLAPNTCGQDEKAEDQKQEFMDQLHAHFEKISHKRRDYIICGSWFSAPQDKDLQNADAIADAYPALTSEQDWFASVHHDLGYLDAFRQVNNDEDEFTWWPDGDRASNGWRSDIQLVSKDISRTVEYGASYTAQQFSSHAPVIIDYDIEL